jgi:ribosomal protein S18 acetylase RimI-like enzyme
VTPDNRISAYREAELHDLPGVCALGEVVNLLHHDAWPSIFAPRSDPSRDAPHWRRSIGQPHATTFVAEHSGELMAFITVMLVDESNSRLQPMRYAHVGSVCVAEPFRGRGIGKQLMSLAEQWAAGRGARDMRLNVWAFNESALAFYEELGYEVRSLFLGKPLI